MPDAFGSGVSHLLPSGAVVIWGIAHDDLTVWRHGGGSFVLGVVADTGFRDLVVVMGALSAEDAKASGWNPAHPPADDGTYESQTVPIDDADCTVGVR